ncbi:unnamed protein product [Clonostachys solani]|uniref:Uncharacterized protein n=1 Tax=Clonostachys solani TaxID=160281 RepID=A0A9P0ERN4_9HYPO|nr:unnamed protein product [Clonostachys solani]
MEVLGAVASVVTLLEVGGKAGKFIKGIHNIPESFAELREEVGFLKAISAELSKAQEAISSGSHSTRLRASWPTSIESIRKTFEGIVHDLEDIQTKCERQRPEAEPAAKRRAWLSHRTRISTLLRKAENAKANLGLALNVFALTIMNAQTPTTGQGDAPARVNETENEKEIETPPAMEENSPSITVTEMQVINPPRTSIVAKMRQIYAGRCRCHYQKQPWRIRSPTWASQLVGGFEVRAWSGTADNSSPAAACTCSQNEGVSLDDARSHHSLAAKFFLGRSFYTLEFAMRSVNTRRFNSSHWTLLEKSKDSIQMRMSHRGVRYFPDDQQEDGTTIVPIMIELEGYDALELLLNEWESVLSRTGFPRQVGYAVRAEQMAMVQFEEQDERKARMLEKVASYVWDEETEPEATPFHEAAIDGDALEMQLVLDKLGSASIKIIDDLDKTGCSALHHASRLGNREAVQALVGGGANINIKDGKDGMTPLMFAAWHGQVECMRALLEPGGGKRNEVNQRSNFGETAIDWAVIGCNPSSVRVLIEHGATILSCDLAGSTLLHKFAGVQCPERDTQEIFRLILEPGKLSINARDNQGITPLLRAIQLNNLPTLRCLMESGASRTARDNNSNNLMHYAATRANLEILEYLMTQDLSELNAEHTNKAKRTPWDCLIRSIYGEPWRLRAHERQASEEEAAAFARLHQAIEYANTEQDISLLQHALDSLPIESPDTTTACAHLAQLSQRKKENANPGDYAFYRAIENDVRAWPSGKSLSDIRNAIQEDLNELINSLNELTVVATGVSSGLGFEAIKQLLQQAQPYKVILGARNTEATENAYSSLSFDRSKHSLSVLPLELNNLKDVKSFARQALEKLGNDDIDYLLLNAAISDPAQGPGPHGSKWSEILIVNHTSQHYLVHLLREKLAASKARLVFVSSGAVRNVPDPSVLDEDLLAGSGKDSMTSYPQSKFVALLAAHWWRRQLAGQCDVVAVSPGLIPTTGLQRGSKLSFPSAIMKDAKSVPEGAKSILEALTRSDFPEDPEQIFLTSWGEWWPKDVYALSLDEALQNKWCQSQEEIETELGITA